jgi:ribosomal protein S12 methylthiotransferase
MEELLGEAARLAAAGVRELVLIAQDVSAYGSDIYGRYALPELLDGLAGLGGQDCAAVERERGTNAASTDAAAAAISDESSRAFTWLRLMYCYEERVTDELIETIARHSNICHYIDLPLQHVSDSVLARMGRRSTRESIERTIAKLRAAVPDIAIRTTFMTGFPGETEEDFAELMDFAAEQRFERLGVFAYSPEEGTRAAAMPDQVPQGAAEERRDALMQRQLDISLEANRGLIGRALNVLVEDREDETTYVGRTEYDAPEIDGAVIFSSQTPVSNGAYATVRITDAMDYDLVGEAL